jgi:hypothetical protein
VRAFGSHFTFFVNDQPVGQADDASFATGVTGVLDVSPNDTGEVVFTQFQIAALIQS